MNDLAERLTQERRNLDRKSGEMQALAANGKKLKYEIEQLEQKDDDYHKVAILIQEVAEKRVDQATRVLESAATSALSSILEEPLTLKITNEMKGRNAVANITVIDAQGVETSVMEARGGGVAAVAGFALRLATLLLTPGLSRSLFLDETFAQLSEDHEEALADFLRDVSERAKTQIVLVTHSRALADSANQAIQVTNRNGKSIVTTLRGSE